MIRAPNTVDLFAAKKGFIYKLFVQFFIDEINLRDTQGRAFNPGKGAAQRYEAMLKRQAFQIWEKAQELGVNPVNLAFVFLNRSYPMFIGQSTPIPRMPFYWDEFLINLSHQGHVLALLNYTEEKKKLVLHIIEEMNEARTSRALENFVTRFVCGYKVVYPEHRYDRSELFETVLVMVKQIEDQKLDYFLENHAIEIVKAHLWYLKKFGDPVNLYLGSLVGDFAMQRLRNYYDWLSEDRPASKKNTTMVELDFSE